MRRHSAGPIRQLSLQAETPKSDRCRTLVKQQSVDSNRLCVTAGPVRRPSPRPGPKVAWADRTTESSVMTQHRPLVVRGSARASSASGPPRSIPNANTELFSRLRKSWREHDHSRRNLNIFLAHAKVNGDDPNDLLSPRSDDEDEDRTRVILTNSSTIEDPSSKKHEIVICSTVDKADKARHSPVPTKNSEPIPPYSVAFSLSIQDETETEAQSSEKKIAIEIDVPRNLQSLTQESTNESKEEMPEQLDILPNKFPTTSLSAAARRLNFKNSKNVQSTPVVEVQTAPLKPTANPPMLVRSSSLQVTSPCPTPTKGILKDRRQLQPAVSFEEVDKLQAFQPPRAKSAPVRKKVKIPQKKGKRCDSPEEDESKEEEKKSANTKNGRRTHRVPSDVITMVSLLSPTTSSDEATEIDNSPSETGATVDADESSPPAADSQSSSTTTQIWDGTPSEFRTFYLRKPAKCVSFQGGNIAQSSTLPVCATATAAVAAVSLAASTAASPLLGYSFTEKRSPSFLTANAEPQTAKRRFIRSPDLSLDLHCPKEESSDCSDAETPTAFLPFVSSDETKEEVPPPSDQPEFRTPKERECWALFRRMTEKGLPVSYDTVLRGLLTPTEYRLCRDSMLTEC